jgi:heterodisulfide reductase subunit D
VNFLELVGDAMGVDRPDLFKQWKMMQDVDRVLADASAQIAAAGLEVDQVREVMMTAILGEQPLPLGRRSPA